MRLNPDCVRAILLCVESSPNPSGTFLFIFSDPTGLMDGYAADDPEISVNALPELKGFSEDEVRYHLKQSFEAGLLNLESNHIPDICVVNDLTPRGHEFLAQIRQETNWNRIKEIASKAGCLSLQFLMSVAQSYISGLLP